MFGSMLVGAWLLIHHQCCALGEEEMRIRNPLLVDTLTRRSSLEKNFMRFGRSSTGVEERCQTSPLDITEGEEPLSSDKRARNPLSSSAKANFIRLGRAKDNFMRFGRGNENFMRFGKSKDNFMRFGRGKDNFMRFGRSERPVQRSGRGRSRDFEDGFIRFGRSLPSPFHPGFIIGPELTLLPPLVLKQRNDNSADNMIRLG
ncbi:FMRFamide-related peptides isoform X2 [Halyomorpha halys]|nr:FMRFamide-related peptides [Halyomorpha halys]